MWSLCSKASRGGSGRQIPSNPNGIGDIGVISSLYPKNFGVEILDDLGGPGAREVKGITLDPQGEGRDANYSKLTAGSVTGSLTGNLEVQESSGEESDTVNCTIDRGAEEDDITIPTVSDFGIGGDTTGIIDVEEVVAKMSIGALAGAFLATRAAAAWHESAFGASARAALAASC